jgi:hypothetical protein
VKTASIYSEQFIDHAKKTMIQPVYRSKVEVIYRTPWTRSQIEPTAASDEKKCEARKSAEPIRRRVPAHVVKLSGPVMSLW